MAASVKRNREDAAARSKKQSRLTAHSGPAPLSKPASAALANSATARTLTGCLGELDPLSRTIVPIPTPDPVLPQGVVLLRGFLNADAQNALVLAVQRLHDATPMELPSFTMYGKQCFYNAYLTGAGKRWDAEKREYSSISTTGAPVPRVPDHFQDVHRSIVSSKLVAASGLPSLPTCDIVVANYYPPRWGSMGGHQDKAESAASVRVGYPVVSISLGDSCDFFFDVPVRLRSPESPKAAAKKPPASPPPASSAAASAPETASLSAATPTPSPAAAVAVDNAGGSAGAAAAAAKTCSLCGRGDECRRYVAADCSRLRFRLDSGDVLLFGGPARLMRHGVAGLHAEMRPKGLVMARGRINVQLRVC